MTVMVLRYLQTYFGMERDLKEQKYSVLKINSIELEVPGKINELIKRLYSIYI